MSWGDSIQRPRNYVRQGITLAGIDVVIVAATEVDAAAVRRLTEAAVAEHGAHILSRSGHPPINGDPVLTAPVLDGPSGTMLGYVELADA